MMNLMWSTMRSAFYLFYLNFYKIEKYQSEIDVFKKKINKLEGVQILA